MEMYWALVEKDAGSAFGIRFPDLPGCFAAADEENAIPDAAAEALALYAQDETSLPSPRGFAAWSGDGAVTAALAAGARAIGVPLLRRSPKARVNVMIDETVLALIDAQTKATGGTRSEYLQQAAIDRLKRERGAAVVD